ncbi:unnamed protein product [Rotaria magnacalcarata]|uniref:Caspase family p20 domain-containing protein n=1 Tax=Rotaria magnacalcarata TaxID=392030 RepID=A0A815WF71_9BILA|nr:unnamed protein product [Rotaria magnacalcarata]CAF1545132.1 unnamed protein product [Rotaria magnacalcarata]
MARSASRQGQRKLAFVIGIGKYDNINKLSNPENDANDMSSALESIGFTVTQAAHLNRVEMQQAIVKFENSIHPGDMVLFYFAGHGVQWKDQNYLLPIDIPNPKNVNLSGNKNKAKNKNLIGITIRAQDVLNTLSDRSPFVIIFLLDCCRTYHLRNPELDQWGAGDSEPADFKSMEKAGSLIAFACAPGTEADEGQGQRNGLFTKHLLQHIKTPNEDVAIMLRTVKEGVKNDPSSKQIPFLNDGLVKKNIFLNHRPQGT